MDAKDCLCDSGQLQANAYCDSPDIVLVGTKADLRDKRSVQTRQARDLADRYNIPYFETSAATGADVDKAVVTLLELVMKRMEQSSGRTSEPNGSPASSHEVEEAVVSRKCCWINSFTITLDFKLKQIRRKYDFIDTLYHKYRHITYIMEYIENIKDYKYVMKYDNPRYSTFKWNVHTQPTNLYSWTSLTCRLIQELLFL